MSLKFPFVLTAQHCIIHALPVWNSSFKMRLIHRTLNAVYIRKTSAAAAGGWGFEIY